MATLYIVGTPIGNLQDMTLRAVETLKSVDIVAAEDTRRTQGLLNTLGISKKTISCRAHNEAASAQGIIKLLEEGKDLAYVSDAGTPGISDPGDRLVRAVRGAGFPVVPIPGPSALATLVSVSGIPGNPLHFEAFLPQKGLKRVTRLRELMDRPETFVIYESPFRILKLLQEIAEYDSERELTAGREMTKVHEEFFSGTAALVLQQLQVRPIIKGEWAVVVSGGKKVKKNPGKADNGKD